ncbi:MAG TPA: serine hydrolase domain-containing protein [bacterium]|nr:serine hydrolase domain-containing protein [bacterium]
MDAIFEKSAPPKAPGGALGVFKQGRAIYLKGYGSKRLGQIDPITSNTVFNLGSVSKQFTAFCILLLQERRRLSIEDDFRDYLTEFGPDFSGIKIRHLMHHSSGLLSLFDLRWLDAWAGAWKPGSPAHIKLISRQKERNFPAGQEHLYNNDGYFLLAEVIRRVSGQSLAQFGAEKIFAPLAMARTHYVEDPNTWIPDRAVGHRRKGDGWQTAVGRSANPGPGSVWSCVDDLGRWAHSIHEQSLGGPALYRAQLRPAKTVLRVPFSPGYAAGLQVGTLYGHRVAAHDGLDTGFSSAFYWLPKSDMAVVLLRNREEALDLGALKVLDFLLNKKRSPTQPAAKPPATLAKRLSPSFKAAAGFYQGTDFQEFWELKYRKRGFLLNYRGIVLPLIQAKNGRFITPDYGPWWTLRLEAKADGAWDLTHFGGSRRLGHLVFVGRPARKVPAPRSLSGHYRSPTGKTFTLRVSDSKIYYRDSYPNGFADIPLRWLAPDKLAYTTDLSRSQLAQLDGNGFFQVIWTKKMEISGLLMVGLGPDNRNRNIHFHKTPYD